MMRLAERSQPRRAPISRPIVFTARLVRQIRAGNQSQTRRLVRVPDGYRISALVQSSPPGAIAERVYAYRPDAQAEAPPRELRCPYGQRGDLLWVKEPWGVPDDDQHPDAYIYRADEDPEVRSAVPWRSSLVMPQSASRLWLRIISVRVQQLDSISCADVRAEGLACPAHDRRGVPCYSNCEHLRGAYRDHWDGIHRDHPARLWRRNPIVWALTFEAEQAPRALR